MLGYEWTNPFVVSSAHSAEEAVPEQPHPRHQVYPLYDRNGFELSGTLFSITPPAPTGGVSPAPVEDDYSVQHYGLSLPPTPAEPLSGSAIRIGLNLGVRTYFASSPDGELMRLGTNVYRRSGGSADEGGDVVSGGMVAPACKARCQAEGCGADLSRAKHYHRRHKVCEFHSKVAAVVAHGLTQRFCQQCSRFHVLSEFDQGKRSCRKRLADHNRRRRKTQPSPATPAPPPPPPPPPPPQQDDCSTTISSPSNAAAPKPSTQGASPGGGAADVAAASVVAPASPTRMGLGRTCFQLREGVPGACCSSSSSSPSSCSRTSSTSVLPHMVDFAPYDRRITMSIWDTNAEDE